jgi:Family of unknown function (DUF5856)
MQTQRIRTPFSTFKSHIGQTMIVPDNKNLELNISSAVEYAPAMIALCFESRTKAHMAHLQTTSYSEHKALDDYYNSIISLTDGFAESYQGRFGIIDHFPEVKLKCACGLHVVEAVRDWIDANREWCGSFSELQNVIDDIVELCNDTIYKLSCLK